LHAVAADLHVPKQGFAKRNGGGAVAHEGAQVGRFGDGNAFQASERPPGAVAAGRIFSASFFRGGLCQMRGTAQEKKSRCGDEEQGEKLRQARRAMMG
jgi:hypothetical protein